MKKRTFFLLLWWLSAQALHAYVGPGAGFAFIGSFFFVFIAFFLAVFNFLTFPFRLLLRFLKRRRTLRHARFKRVVVIGFDGMDYRLFNRFRQEKKNLAGFEQLIKTGSFLPLWSTEPPISPVAWATFATGTNPGKHNIFDFLTTDRQTYMPMLSGAEIIPSRRILKIGRWELPLGSPRIELKRKSQSFWKIVAAKGMYAAVLRVPFTFPPEKFYGTMLAGLGTPDLRGTQGSFTFFSTAATEISDVSEAVVEKLTPITTERFSGHVRGPVHPFAKGHPVLSIPFELTIDKQKKSARITIDKKTVVVEAGRFSPWIRLTFKAGPAAIHGIVQWLLREVDPPRLYLSPIHLDPEKPAMPVSWPKIFSVYLAKLLGSFATLGMAEDTWAMNEKVISETDFIAQVDGSQREREAIFWDSLKKVRHGLIVQVFEATDRIQHMFWRYLAGPASPAEKASRDDRIVNAIYHSYRQMDEFLVRLLKRLRADDLLLVVSDHGFNAFNRGFNLNSWLHREGYLQLREGRTVSGKWYADVDWTRSRAYGQGLNGIFLNLRGREKQGIVTAGAEAENLKKEIRDKLLRVRDDANGKPPIKSAWVREDLYHGPYTDNAPDVVVGYTAGYRVSWESAVNSIGQELFSDNTRLWSGDHAFTRDQVPGIFFSNRKIGLSDPALLDIAPTVLKAFGIPVPAFMEGRDLKVE